MDTESALNFPLDVLLTLESNGAPYMVVGAFAATIYGSTRITYDIDVVVLLDEGQIQALVAAYPPPRYYADPEQMRDSIHYGTLFNVIDTQSGGKLTWFLYATIPSSAGPSPAACASRSNCRVANWPQSGAPGVRT